MNQDDFNYKALEQLKIIASRLESIKRMLGDQEEDCPVVDRSEAMDKLDELLSRPDPILEHVWRPMSAAPTNGELILARTFSGIEIYVSFDFSALECHWRDTDNNGWSYEDLTGWRPL